MRLREIIEEIPDDDWLEIFEQTPSNYKSYIGRAPKKYVVGEVLDFEALHLGDRKSDKNGVIHRFLVTNKFSDSTER